MARISGPVVLGVALLVAAGPAAVRDARAQAEAVASTMGVELGRVFSVALSRAPGAVPFYRADVAFAAAERAPEHRAGLIEISQEASVSFEIVQQPFIQP